MNYTTTNEGVFTSLYFLLFDHFQKYTHGSFALYNILLCSTALVIVFFLNKSSRKLTSKEVAALNKNRKYGHWVPDYDFSTPIPAPYRGWDIKTTEPIPYRAFRHKYSINMGIRAMEWEDWIELDNEWPKYHLDKMKRIAEKGSELYGTSPIATEAAYELLDEFWNYLPNRYPSLFKQTKQGLDNIITGETFLFKKGYRTKEDPMLIAASLVQDDLAIMIENEEGEYILRAGAIMLAGFWRLKDKFNMPLSKIHTSGDVPKYKEKLQSGMEKFFIRQTVDKPVIRNNYFIQTDDQLPWSVSIGDENNESVGWYTAEPAKTAEQLYFRSERQSLRRLPKTGATVFTIRTYFLPITKLAREPYVPRRLFNAINSWELDVQDYRGLSKFKDTILPYLEEMAEKQEKEGYLADNEEQKYPF
ncbi:uncharacterized protein PRCAT00005509001 [Priceomyces carsonii]|uniref:uncharacterized protein n=1 Tax=Priceomyces carsonii TaxID=28549 RepID=UPI002EDA2208|nr:unnamed protein product [Priceomyces carsonii]